MSDQFITGLGSLISYNRVEALNIALGSGADSFTVTQSNSGTLTTISTGDGADVVNVLATTRCR